MRGNEYCSPASEHVETDHFTMKCTCNVKFSSWALSPPPISPSITPIPQFMLFTLPKQTHMACDHTIPKSLLPLELPQCPTLPSKEVPCHTRPPQMYSPWIGTSQHPIQYYKEWRFLMFLKSTLNFLKHNLLSILGKKKWNQNAFLSPILQRNKREKQRKEASLTVNWFMYQKGKFNVMQRGSQQVSSSGSQCT